MRFSRTSRRRGPAAASAGGALGLTVAQKVGLVLGVGLAAGMVVGLAAGPAQATPKKKAAAVKAVAKSDGGKVSASTPGAPSAAAGGAKSGDEPAKPVGVDKTLADFLDAPAKAAIAKRNYRLAVSLYRGIVAIRGDGDAAMVKLAEAWTLAGQFDAAIEEWERYRDTVADPTEKTRAISEIERLKGRTQGFEGNVFEPEPASKEAAAAFKKGRGFFSKKKYADAILLFKAGYAMAPDMPGPLRELGSSYDALGRAAEANAFFVRYLQVRPFGANADRVRDRLRKVGSIGKLAIDTSFPCELVMMNRQVVPAKLPMKDFVVAPGRYKLLCYSEKYHLASYEEVTVGKGGSGKVMFQWSIVENKLQPWGRIVMENPAQAGMMNDIGVWEEVGVPVPQDRRALKFIIKSGDGSRSETRFLKLEPGKRLPIKW